MNSDETIEWYLDMIRRELIKLRDGKFTGGNNFEVNHKNGGIANMNVGLRKSVRKPQ